MLNKFVPFKTNKISSVCIKYSIDLIPRYKIVNSYSVFCKIVEQELSVHI